MKRYCMLQFIERLDPDEVSMMYPIIDGRWIKYGDYLEDIEKHINKIALLKDGLKSLKNCKIDFNSPEELNLYVTNLLEAAE